MPRGFLNRITTRLSSAVGIQRAMNGFDVSTIGTRWKLMSVSVNCGRDAMHVGVHPAQDRVGHRFGGVAALGLVAVDLLDPFEVDHRHHADLQVGVLREVHLVIHHRPVQALVEQQVAIVLERRPVGEGARRRAQNLAASSSSCT